MVGPQMLVQHLQLSTQAKFERNFRVFLEKWLRILYSDFILFFDLAIFSEFSKKIGFNGEPEKIQRNISCQKKSLERNRTSAVKCPVLF